jgi:predicted DNA-binding transcriptional regulator AlpA
MNKEPGSAGGQYPVGYFDQLVTEKEAAKGLGYSVRALQNWRLRGGGPVFVKVSSRSVRYRRGDLRDWTQERLRTSTSDMGKGGRVEDRPFKLNLDD